MEILQAFGVGAADLQRGPMLQQNRNGTIRSKKVHIFLPILIISLASATYERVLQVKAIHTHTHADSLVGCNLSDGSGVIFWGWEAGRCFLIMMKENKGCAVASSFISV